MEKEIKSTRFNHFYVNPHENSSSSVDVGLQILIQLSHTQSNVVMKPTLKLKKPTFSFPQNTIDTSSSCSYESSAFLQSCHLCNNNLSPDKDVYMYRGDQGFCSVECRSRQIYLDEMREIEASTKKILASFRHCHRTDGWKSRELFEEFRNRHTPLSSRKNWAIVVDLGSSVT